MDIRIPNLGEGADSGSVVNIFVKEGDKVTKDQTLLELENEKAVAPIPSTVAGTVTKVYVKVGDKVSVGQAIVAVGEEGAPAAPASAPTAAPTSTEARVVRAAPQASAPAAPATGEYKYESKAGLPPPASPTVRRVAAELGIDLTRVRGSEAGGRIGMGDLKAHIAALSSAASRPAAASPSGVSAQTAKAPAEKIDFSKWGNILKKPVSSLRQKIADKMLESWTTIPHVTQFDEADITAVMALRKKLAPAYEKKGVHLTITPIIMKAVLAALKKFPVVNSSLDEEAHELILKEYYHFGVAVDTEAGLIVPVVRDVNKKSILEIAKDLDQLAEKTRARKVSIDDLKGGTFTISNLGSIGGSFFTPIINKPEVAILGVGRGAYKSVVVPAKGGSASGGKAKAKTGKDSVETRLLLPLGLSYDHRVIDGADGARFIREIVTNLENFKEADLKI